MMNSSDSSPRQRKTSACAFPPQVKPGIGHSSPWNTAVAGERSGICPMVRPRGPVVRSGQKGGDFNEALHRKRDGRARAVLQPTAALLQVGGRGGASPGEHGRGVSAGGRPRAPGRGGGARGGGR